MCFDKHSDRQVLSPSVFDTRTLSNECRGGLLVSCDTLHCGIHLYASP